jgi:hypothetical protein
MYNNEIIKTLLILMGYLDNGNKLLPCSEAKVQDYVMNLLENTPEVIVNDIVLTKTWDDKKDGYKFMARKKNFVYSFVLRISIQVEKSYEI